MAPTYDPEELEKLAEIDAAQKAVAAAGEVIKQLKAASASKEEIDAALSALNEAKNKEKTLSAAFFPIEKLDIDRDALESLLVRRFFFCPSFSIYGGVKGFYDFGPPGCAVKSNMINFWKQWFILEESMLEIDSATITPHVVLLHSGHVERFNDLMVKDLGNGKYHRADHLLEDHMDTLLAQKGITSELKQEYLLVRNLADDYSPEELTAVLRKYGAKAPETGNEISEAFPSNLMFGTQVGRGEGGESYLRPETAQGIFVNFARLLDYNGGKIPFAAATVGSAYRNEISPRSALLRVREFTLAEIEHFVDPADKSHPKFDSIKDVKVRFLSKRRQKLPYHIPQSRTIGEALASGIIQNETMGYFIARTNLYLQAIGIKADYLRFRQHKKTEKAHYAQDCWDAEILTSYGWVECVGIADRACYDLTKHAEGSGAKLSAFQRFDTPKETERLSLAVARPVIAKAFRQATKAISDYLTGLDESAVVALQAEIKEKNSAKITIGADSYDITPDMVSFKQEKVKINGRNFTPSVIEPSFGVGRIMYSLLEHNFYTRAADANRNVIGLSPLIAPVKCSVLPLQQNPAFLPVVQQISSLLTAAGISVKVDDTSTTIGKRYARTDEIGIPFGITVDFETIEKPENPTVTLRERDSTAQIRIPIADLVPFLLKIVNNQTTWEAARAAYLRNDPVVIPGGRDLPDMCLLLSDPRWTELFSLSTSSRGAGAPPWKARRGVVGALKELKVEEFGDLIVELEWSVRDKNNDVFESKLRAIELRHMELAKGRTTTPKIPARPPAPYED